MIFFYQLVELRQLFLIIILCAAVNRKHSGGISHAQYLLPGKLPVNIARKSCKKCNVLYMRLLS